MSYTCEAVRLTWKLSEFQKTDCSKQAKLLNFEVAGVGFGNQIQNHSTTNEYSTIFWLTKSSASSHESVNIQKPSELDEVIHTCV